MKQSGKSSKSSVAKQLSVYSKYDPLDMEKLCLEIESVIHESKMLEKQYKAVVKQYKNLLNCLFI